MIQTLKARDINLDFKIKTNLKLKSTSNATGDIWLYSLPTIQEVNYLMKLDFLELKVPLLNNNNMNKY